MTWCLQQTSETKDADLYVVVRHAAGRPDLAVLIFPSPVAADAWARHHALDHYTVVPTRFIATSVTERHTTGTAPAWAISANEPWRAATAGVHIAQGATRDLRL